MDASSVVAALAFSDENDVRAVGTNPWTRAMGATRTSSPTVTSRRAWVDEVRIDILFVLSTLILHFNSII